MSDFIKKRPSKKVKTPEELINESKDSKMDSQPKEEEEEKWISRRDIQREFGVTNATVINWLNKYQYLRKYEKLTVKGMRKKFIYDKKILKEIQDIIDKIASE